MVQNFIDRHAAVEPFLKALVKHRHRDLDEQVDDEDDVDVYFAPPINLLAVEGTAPLELCHTAALAKHMIDLADLVEHGAVDGPLQLAFHLLRELFSILVDRVAHFLTILDEFVGVGLIMAILHDLL